MAWPAAFNYTKQEGAHIGPKKGGNPLSARLTGNWIAGAIKHPGALHKQLGVPAGDTIPAGKLNKAAKAGGKLGQRARLAKTLKSLH